LGFDQKRRIARAGIARFDVFVTVDRHLSFQQNLAPLTIADIVLQAPTNRLADLQLLVPQLLVAIASAAPGAATVIGHP
jgi:hypothetical protein